MLYGESSSTKFSRNKWILLPFFALALALFVGLVSSQLPLVLLVALLLLPVGVGVIVRPETATLLVVFLVYSNAIIVGVRFHGIPKAVGGALSSVLLAIPLVSYLLFRRQKLLYHNTLTILIVFYVWVQFAGAWIALHSDEALVTTIELLVEGVILYFLLINTIRSSRMLRLVVWTLLLAGLLLGSVPLYQQLTGTYDNNYYGFGQLSNTGFETGEENIFGEVRQFRLAGAIGEKNRYAQIMLVLVPLGLFRFFQESSWLLRILAMICTGVIVFGFVLAFSRGGAISFFLMIVIMVFFRFIRTNHFLWIIGAAALLLIAFPEYGTRIASIQSIQGFISPEESSSEAPDGAIEGRATEMLAAVLVFVDHPVLGVGPDMFRYYSREYGNKLGIHAIEEQREAHSLYLDIAANNGILGLVGFLGIVVVTLVELFRVRKRWLEEHPDVANIAASFIMANVAYLATGIFLHLSYIRYFWLLMALSSAVILVSREMEKAEVAMPVNRTERLGR